MRITRVALCAAMAVAGIVAVAPPASAYDLIFYNSTCSVAKFSSADADVVLHLAEANVSTADETAITDAVTEVNATIARSGGTKASIKSTTTTRDPYSRTMAYTATTPTIHVGFADTLPGPGDLGLTNWGPATVSGSGSGSGSGSKKQCLYNEAHVTMLSNAGIVTMDKGPTRWDYGTAGADYYEAGTTGADGFFFRPNYLHELLHAFGLGHTDSEYAMMNYGVKPFANRTSSDRIRPLPDDVKALRELYAGTSTRFEVAALNTWYNAAPGFVSESGAATGTLLCSPSLGADYDADKFAGKCGTGGSKAGSTAVCKGDHLRVRYTVANYSTSTVMVMAWVFFSGDITLDSADTGADSSNGIWIKAGGSKVITASVDVPDLAAYRGLQIKPIMRLNAWPDTDDDGVAEGVPYYTDWAPTQGWLTTC